MLAALVAMHRLLVVQELTHELVVVGNKVDHPLLEVVEHPQALVAVVGGVVDDTTVHVEPDELVMVPTLTKRIECGVFAPVSGPTPPRLLCSR